MRTSRLLSILIQLQLRGSATAEALAREFEVSVRTIYRDIERLGASGVPVYADRGPGGGFRLLDGYRTRLTGLETDEAEALYMIGLPGPAEALGIGDAAGRAGRKMLAALPASRGELAGKLGDCFHLDPIDWYRAEPTPEHLPDIARAVLAGNGLAMTYDSWTGVRDWSVRPLGLVLKAGHWYLVAEGHGKRRIFKVSSIRAHAPDGSTFERPRDFDLGAWWSAETARFEAELRRDIASLHVTVPGLKRIADLGAYAQAAVGAAIATGEAGWMRIELPIEHVEQAALLLLGIGPDVRVVAPESLRLRLGELARAVAGMYEEAGP
jgi:predicted DNA-binding transcriptional regulator YafY